jgi:hypothetical protein
MEHPKFKEEQKVSFGPNIKTDEKAHVVTVYSPSQKKKLGADYRVILSSGEELDVKESDIRAA